MSQENVEIVRAIYEAWSESRSAAPFIERDLEYVNPPEAVEPGTRIGRRYLAAVQDVYPDFRIEPERFVDAGDDVVVIASIRGRGVRSQAVADQRQGYVWTLRDGKAIRFRWFNDPRQALEAVGLSEQDAHAEPS